MFGLSSLLTIFFCPFTLFMSFAPADYIVVGTDSGRIVILEYNPTKNSFDRVRLLLQPTLGSHLTPRE